MKNDPNLMKRFFLGDTSPEERVGLENSYLTDVEVFEGLVAAENDLIDSYARGKLSSVERQQFERQYLISPQRMARVEFARSLSKIGEQAKLSAHPERVSFWRRVTAPLRQTRPSLQWALVLSAVVVVTGSGAWLVRQNQELRSGLQQARAIQFELRQQLAARNEELRVQAQNNVAAGEREIAKLEEPPSPDVSLTLNPGILRSNQVRQGVLTLPSRVSWARLQLSLEDDDKHVLYEAIVETAEGHEIQRVASLKSHVLRGHSIVTLRLPLSVIQPGDYVVKLNAANGSATDEKEVEVYSFRTVRK